MEIRFKRICTFLINQTRHNRIINYAAQLSYSLLLAFTPLFMLVYNLINWLSTDLNARMISTLKTLIPNFMIPLIDTARISAAGPQTSLWANIVFAVFITYFSVAMLRSFVITTTKVMGFTETRNYFLLWGIGIIYLICTTLLILFFITYYLITQKALILLFEFVGLSAIIIQYWRFFSLAIIACYLALALSLVYMFAPPKRLPFLAALPGGIFVSLGWLCVTLIYNQLVNLFYNINSITVFLEGPFSFIIMIFFICFVLVLGSVVNLYFYAKKGACHETESTHSSSI